MVGLYRMQAQEIEQIKNILANCESSTKKIPYLSDLEQHPAFWPLFSSLSLEQKEEVRDIIKGYLEEKLQTIQKTKWGQLFARFAEASPEIFWKFRELNDRSNTDSTSFQTLGKQVEIEMFKLEWILTEKMLKQEKGLDKVIDSFYTIVYLFFPRFSEVE